jgi:hypothetical protein
MHAALAFVTALDPADIKMMKSAPSDIHSHISYWTIKSQEKRLYLSMPLPQEATGLVER